ncbi:MAG: MoaD/ThiS family protein [Nitrospinota bacterium]
MRIEVRVFAHFVNYLPQADRREKRSFLELPEGARISDVITRLGIPQGEVNLLMRNDRQASEGEVLDEGDIVGIFPAIAGGRKPA